MDDPWDPNPFLLMAYGTTEVLEFAMLANPVAGYLARVRQQLREPPKTDGIALVRYYPEETGDGE
jgi:hypothetical protein